MAWNGVRTWAAGEVLTAANLTTYINDNLNYLLTPNIFNISASSGTWTTTSTTFTNIDASTSTTITTHGGYVLLSFHGTFYTGTSVETHIAVTLDGTAYPIAGNLNTNNDIRGVVTGHYFWAPTAGVHTVALQWKVSSAGTATLNKAATVPFQFWGIEL